MWIQLHASVRNHPKVALVARDCCCSVPEALGHIVALWCWAMDAQPDGCLSAYDDDSIEMAAMWAGESGWFVASLRKRRLLDDGNQLHDWMEYAGALKRNIARSRERAKKTSVSRDSGATVVRQSCDNGRLDRDVDVDVEVRDHDLDHDRESSLQASTPLAPRDKKRAPPAPVDNPFIAIPTRDGDVQIDRSEVDAWTGLYGLVDVPAELRKMAGYWGARPKSERKTAVGIRKSIVGWLAKAQDKAPPKAAPEKPYRDPDEDMLHIHNGQRMTHGEFVRMRRAQIAEERANPKPQPPPPPPRQNTPEDEAEIEKLKAEFAVAVKKIGIPFEERTA